MKRYMLLGIVSIVIIAIAALGGYMYYQSSVPASEANKTLIIGSTDPMETTDPIRTHAYWDYVIATTIYDTLVRHSVDSVAIEPCLAENWTMLNNVTWDFYLRQNVKFHDGTPFNASCVKYSIDRAINDGEMSYTQDCISSIEVMSNYVVRFHLKYPCAYFLAVIACFNSAIVSPTALENLGDEAFNLNPVGSGPWKFESWRMGEELVLKANKDYWDTEWTPKLDKIIIRFLGDSSTLKLALEEGSIDVAERYILPQDVASLKSNPDVVALPAVSGYIRVISLDCSKPPFDNLLVREAFAYAINYTEIINKPLKGEAIRLLSAVSPAIFPESSKSSFEKYQQNITKAHELLTQAGYSDGVDIKLWYTPAHYGPVDGDIAVIVADSIKAAGFNAEIKTAEWGTYIQSIMAGTMTNAFQFGWIFDYPDPHTFIEGFYGNTSWLGGFGYYNNDTYTNETYVNELLQKEMSEYDPVKRNALLGELQDYMAETLHIIPLFSEKFYVFTRTNVKDLIVGPVHYTLGHALAHAYKTS